MLFWKDTKPFLGTEKKNCKSSSLRLMARGAVWGGCKEPSAMGGSDKSQH